MNVIKYLLISLIMALGISCNSTKRYTVKTSIPFPIIIDKFKEHKVRYISENKSSHGFHHPYYIGKYNDTISIAATLRNHPPPPPQINEDGTLVKRIIEPSNNKFGHYFGSFERLRKFSNRDSINLLIKIDTSQIISNRGNISYPVIICNLSKDTTYIGYGAHIPIVTEAKNKQGEWKPIEISYTYMCGFGLEAIILPPGEILVTSELIYSGAIKALLRIRMGNSLSKPFYGEINETQFKSEWY